MNNKSIYYMWVAVIGVIEALLALGIVHLLAKPISLIPVPFAEMAALFILFLLFDIIDTNWLLPRISKRLNAK